MLIIGAGGFAKEVLEICHQNGELENLCFYDDINSGVGGRLFNQFPIIKTPEEAKKYFETTDNRFILGLGNPYFREELYNKFKNLGGKPTSTISSKADIGSYGVNIDSGTNILDGVKISNEVKIGRGVIIYYNSIITHDCVLGDYVQVSPAVSILGQTLIGKSTQIGAGSIILPGIKVGENVKIGAGTIVTKELPDNCTAVGSPAKIIKQE